VEDFLQTFKTDHAKDRSTSNMSKKLYVGNLSFSSTEDDVRDHFAPYGEVISVNLITDRETGRLRGFGFVEMDDEGANAAIQALDGKELGGRTLKVNEAQDKPRSGGSGGRRGGGYSGGGSRW
jgi:RNA recognition motif-containing protein